MINSLRDYISASMQDCMGLEGSRLSQARRDLKRRFLGMPYEADDERRERGLSTYVDRTVLETVEWAKPGLFRLFSENEILRFEPRSPEQEQAALDAAKYINHLIFYKNIFSIVYNVLSDGLYQRIGWCLVHAPVSRQRRVRRFAGLSREEARALLCGPDLSRPDVEVRVSRRAGKEDGLFDIYVRNTLESQEIRIDPVPSEQVIISADARDVESARFVAHWQVRTASDLRREGWSEELIASLPRFDSGRAMPETRTGRAVNHEGGSSGAGGVGLSGVRGGRAPSDSEFKVYEAWFDFDIDGDGIAEKVKAVYAGDGPDCVLMGWEEWPMYRPPLFAACSVPLPHQAVGLCLADLVSDVQDLRTEVTRQFLDNLALANQGELVVNEGSLEGSVEFDSLLARGVGAVHRIKGDASITPLPAAASTAEALNGIQMCEGLAERRTGISSRVQRLDAASLPHTATAASIIEEAASQRLELVARVFCETFFKPLGRYLLHLVHFVRDMDVEMKLFGRPMALDIRGWDPDMNIAAAAAINGASRSRSVEMYEKILGLQYKFVKEMGEKSPVRLSHLVHTCHKMAEAAGLEAPERFFGRVEAEGRAR